MKITIHSLDYSPALDAIHPLTIERKLNEPTVCRFWLTLPSQGTLPNPARNQSVSITGDDGTLYFTGYVASPPLPEYAGLAMDGPRHRLAIRAVSDEFLMDQLSSASLHSAAGITAAQLMQSLVTHTPSATLSAPDLQANAPIGNFASAPGAPWSKTAGQIAAQTRAAYRAVSGVLSLSEIPSAVHPLNQSDGTLDLAALSFSPSIRREFANDITVCGQHEPVAYVTEYFLGDGITSQFNLGEPPWFPPSSTAAIVDELFNQPALDLTVWNASGPSGALSLGPGGLAMNGGTGVDGQTMLTRLDPVELGGTLLMEASGIALAAGSRGILAGLYAQTDTVQGCLAGFQVTSQPVTGALTLQPIVQGQQAGSTYPIHPANQYTLRVRLHCPECERTLAIYRSFGDDGAIVCGGQSNQAPAYLLFEIQEFVNGVAGMSVILYDGNIASLFPSCSVVPASLTTMTGSMRSFRLTNLGTAWVVSTPAAGSPYTRRLGSPVEAAECNLDRSGRLVFATGCIPASGERIAISYRTLGRAVGRAVNAASQQILAAAGLPSVAQWIGSVTSPPPRSSADCRNAAAAIAQASGGALASWNGSYQSASASLVSDIWPGDSLLLNSTTLDLNAQVVVRSVKLTYASTYPDLVGYDISFANDWASDLAIATSDSVPADAWLPAPVSLAPLPNLAGLSVTTLSATTVTINTGATAPSGGGFEIRRRDFAFMPGDDSSLVMRGSQPNMTFSRETAGDRFYIRMFDASTPPNYSEFSTALFINLPIA